MNTSLYLLLNKNNHIIGGLTQDSNLDFPKFIDTNMWFPLPGYPPLKDNVKGNIAQFGIYGDHDEACRMLLKLMNIFGERY